MGANQSAHIDESKTQNKGSDVRGRKSELVINRNAQITMKNNQAAAETTDEDTVASRDVSDSEDEEEDEEWKERLRILEDARSLKDMAELFLHPEMPVKSHATACARCYFDRPSAPRPISQEEAEEQDRALEDMKNLKTWAIMYLHPENPVQVDAEACARNYMTRPSAPEQESKEDTDERARIMLDAQALKKLSVGSRHPELPIRATDCMACGRNYFTRASAPGQESPEEAKEHTRILAEAALMKKLAVDYMHPEAPLQTTDPTVFGRNYFSRPSAPEQESEEQAEERAMVLADAHVFKKLAVDYLHPEKPLEIDAVCMARNYFTRASAPAAESMDFLEEKASVLAEAKFLKELATNYMHPEKPLAIDPTSTARNYFTRPSAAMEEDSDEADERARILADCASLKKLAIDYRHPELPVSTVDSTAFGRNYFMRGSAPEQTSNEDEAARAQIMADITLLKKLAVDFKHPELPVEVDSTGFGRNFFSRASAPCGMTQEESEAMDAALLDARALKMYAAWYMHPEKPVAVDTMSSARNYFTRASAISQEDMEDASERARVLADTKLLKQMAVAYLHPEIGVKTTDGASRGRNYFDRPSAFQHNRNIHTYPAHEDDDHTAHEHLDHFGFDEDMRHQLEDLRHEIHQPFTQDFKDDKESGNLSRSPSSIMLFPGEVE